MQPFENAVFLHNTAIVIEEIKFYGPSWVPKLNQHAFFADDEKLNDAWSMIPDDVDILITHTPPAGILDVSSRGLELGCKHLSKRLNALDPMLHCFGHVHASAGSAQSKSTTFINASSVNSNFEIARDPFEYDSIKKALRNHERLWKPLFNSRR